MSPSDRRGSTAAIGILRRPRVAAKDAPFVVRPATGVRSPSRTLWPACSGCRPVAREALPSGREACDSSQQTSHTRKDPPMSDAAATYVPPKIWKWERPSGGRFVDINRPVAGPTHEKELPVGE